MMKKQHSQEEQKILENTKLVIAQAISFYPTNVSDLDDYIQAGLIGLLYAIRTFDEKKGNFYSWAKKLIFQCILREYYKFHQTNGINGYDGQEPIISYDDKLSDFIPNNLETEELFILEMRASGHTMDEIGSKLNKSQAWVSNKINKILKKLKKLHDEKT